MLSSNSKQMVYMHFFVSLFTNIRRKGMEDSAVTLPSGSTLSSRDRWSTVSWRCMWWKELLVLPVHLIVVEVSFLFTYHPESDWNRDEQLSKRLFSQALSSWLWVSFTSSLENETVHPPKSEIFSEKDIFPPDQFHFYFLMNI